MSRNRLTTLLPEIVIGIGVAVGILLYAAHGPFSWMPQRKWVAFSIMSSSIFGVPLWWYRQSWKRAFFWIVFVGLLIAHAVAYYLVFSRLKEFPPLWGPLCIPLEWAVIFPALKNAVRVK